MAFAELLDPALAGGAAVVAVAGLVRGLSGFGGALVMAPLLSLLFGPAPAVAMTITIELAGYVQLLPGAARHIRWREVGPMGLAALAAMPLGVYGVVHIDPEPMRRLIGGIVALLAGLLMLGWRARRRPGLPAALGVSALSGLLQGLAGTPGPPVVLYLYVGPDAAAVSRQQLIGYFTLLDLAGLLLFAWQGTLAAGALERALLLIPVSILATWLGGHLFRQAGEALLRWLALALILLIGLVGLLA
jgi:uncharacterized protein